MFVMKPLFVMYGVNYYYYYYYYIIGFHELSSERTQYAWWCSAALSGKFTLFTRTALILYVHSEPAQCQDNVTERDNRSLCMWPAVPERQHYKVATSAYLPLLMESIWCHLKANRVSTATKGLSTLTIAPCGNKAYVVGSHT